MIDTTIEYRDTKLQIKWAHVEMPCIPPIGTCVSVKEGLVKITQVDYDPSEKRLYLTGHIE